jgi:hypothetical protein
LKAATAEPSKLHDHEETNNLRLEGLHLAHHKTN